MRRIFHILFCATRRLMASSPRAQECIDIYIYMYDTYCRDVSNERTSERANITASGCLRNPLSCYTLRPSIVARTKNTVLYLAAPSASGVNILSTLFFHRTRPPSPSPPALLVFSLFSLVVFLLSPTRREAATEGKQAVNSFARSLAHFPDLKASSR